jgi:hypothetical protein
LSNKGNPADRYAPADFCVNQKNMKTIAKILFILFILQSATMAFCANEEKIKASETAVKKIAKAFAASSILGTGGHQYLTSVTILADEKAIAIIGQNDGYGNDRNAYHVNIQAIKGKWKITSIEYIFTPTGEKKVEAIVPPYPDPYWDKLLKENK